MTSILIFITTSLFTITTVCIIHTISDFQLNSVLNCETGLNFTGVILFIAAFYGLLGFLRESLAKLCLSWVLMIFVIALLSHSAVISQVFEEDLSHLINSDAENAFKYHSYNTTDPKYVCCGWKSAEEMLINNDTLPCACCKTQKGDTDNNDCNDPINDKDLESEYICRIDSDLLKNKSCESEVLKSHKQDLTVILVFIILVIVLCFLSIILTFILSNDLLKVHHD